MKAFRESFRSKFLHSQEKNQENADDVHLNILNEEPEYENILDKESIYENVPVAEHEIEYSNIKNLKEIKINKNQKTLKILNCPSTSLAFLMVSLLVHEFFIKFVRSLCVKFEINGNAEELNEMQLMSLITNMREFGRSFLISFESKVDGACYIYWRLKDTMQVFSLEITQNTAKVGDFVRNFLLKSLSEGMNGLHHSINFPIKTVFNKVFLYMLSDIRSFNLLFLAAESGKGAIVKFLIDHFDVNHMVRDKIAADLAFECRNYDTILILLTANSKFPKHFKSLNINDLPFEFKKFTLMLNEMHESIVNQNEQAVLQLLEKNPAMRYFYDLNNNSALAKAIKTKSFNIYKLLVQKHVGLGPHENLDEILNNLSDKDRNRLSELNIENSQSLAEGYILTLIANSNVGPDDDQREARLNHVLKAYQVLNTMQEVKILLQLVAAYQKFQIIFDFNRDEVQFLDPRSESYVNGWFYTCGRIYVAAMHLMDDKRAHEVYGTIAHEICHFVMFKVFNNMARPYKNSDKKNKKVFQEISKHCHILKEIDPIIEWVYSCYDEDQQHAELIVRIPHIVSHYYNDQSKLNDILSGVSQLYEYYVNVCLPEMDHRLTQLKRRTMRFKFSTLCKLRTAIYINIALIIAFIIMIIYCLCI